MCDDSFDRRAFAINLLKVLRETNSKIVDIEEVINDTGEDGACDTFIVGMKVGLVDIQDRLNVYRDSAISALRDLMPRDDWRRLISSWNEDIANEHRRRRGFHGT